MMDTPIQITLSPDLQYLIDCLGFGAGMVGIIWMLCFLIRNGIDGSRAIARAIKHRKPFLIRKILIGEWRALPDCDKPKPDEWPI